MLECIAAIIYIMARVGFSFYYYFSVFWEERVTSKIVVFLALVGFMVLEFLTWVYHDHTMPIYLQFGLLIAQIPFGMYVVKGSKTKKLLIILYLAHFALLFQTIALVCGAQFKLGVPSLLVSAVVLVLLDLITFPIIKGFVDRHREPLLKTKVKDVLELSNVLLVFSFIGTTLLYNFQSVRDWYLVLGRLGTTVPAMLFIYIIIRLVRERELHSHLEAQSKYLEELRTAEQARYDYIFASWQNTRSLRHDLRHLALLMKTYLTNGNYGELRKLLEEIKDKTVVSPNK